MLQQTAPADKKENFWKWHKALQREQLAIFIADWARDVLYQNVKLKHYYKPHHSAQDHDKETETSTNQMFLSQTFFTELRHILSISNTV